MIPHVAVELVPLSAYDALAAVPAPKIDWCATQAWHEEGPILLTPRGLLLAYLRLPAIKLMWAKLAQQCDKEGWPAARFLAALAEHEIADRGRRRIERHLAEARSPVGKTLDSFDFETVPMGQQGANNAPRADSDEAGHAFQCEAGHCSDPKPASVIG